MYGYATDETEELMPLTITLAHKLNKKMADGRRDGTLPWVRPDSKSQVGCRKDTMIQCIRGGGPLGDRSSWQHYTSIFEKAPLGTSVFFERNL